jgi:hypothetical protein
VSAFPLSTDVYNAILASGQLDTRVVSALTVLRDAVPANPGNLDYFTTAVVLTPHASVFGTDVQKPIPDETGGFNSLVNQYKNLVTANAGSVTSRPGSAIAPLTFDFPNLTTAESGQVRNGHVTINLVNIESQINGPIGTSTHLDASPNPVEPSGIVTLGAVVSGNGLVHPTPPEPSVEASQSELLYQVTFFEGADQLGAAQIDVNGRASIDVSGLSPGRHSIRAHYDGDPNFAPSDSNTVVVVVGNLNGPRVDHVDRFGIHMQPTSLLIVFDEALEAASATTLSNYRIVARGRDGKFGTRDDIAIKLKSAVYDATAHAVTLSPARRLPLSRKFRLTVRGTIADELGTPLDGKGNGTNGSDYVTTISRDNLVILASAHKHAAKHPGAAPNPTHAASDTNHSPAPPHARAGALRLHRSRSMTK